MMGDGLHLEPDGKWITRDYKRLAKLLIPELKEEERLKRTVKAANINFQMNQLLAKKKCTCGGTLVQSRSGSKVAYCEIKECGKRYKAKTVKK